MSWILIWSALVPAAPLLAPTGDQCFVEEAKLVASGPTTIEEFFGESVAISGDTALIGAATDHTASGRTGAAYVFVRSGTSWIEQARLEPPDGADQDYFGGSVSLWNDTALIGAHGHDGAAPLAGAAYVFVRDGTSWSLQAKLTADDAQQYDWFGLEVSLHGDTAAIGAPIFSTVTHFPGSVYVFVRNGTTWTQQAELRGNMSLGYSVGVFGNTLVAGDANADNNAGAAFVFVRNGATWTEQAKLTASDASPSTYFARAIAIWEDTIFAGGGQGPGAAYVFERNGTDWVEQAKLTADDGADGDGFASGAIALAQDTAVLGATGHDAAGNGAGAAYVFRRHAGGWAQQVKLLASDGEAGDGFGTAVSVSGGAAVIGARLDGDLQEGSAYVFSLPQPTGTIYCTCAAGSCGNADSDAGCANSTGHGALLTGHGTTVPDALNLAVVGARPGQFGILFEGDDAVEVPFGDGFRCTSGGFVRVTRPPILVQHGGSASFGPCFGDPTISSSTGVVPGSGETKHYQFWYRDPGGPCGAGFNLSNGLAITW